MMINFTGSGVEIIISHSADINRGDRYDIRMYLDRGASITKVSRAKEDNEDASEDDKVILTSKQLETNRLGNLFSHDQLYGGFFVKIKVKQDYTGVTLGKAGASEDPVLAVKDHAVQGKKDGNIFSLNAFYLLYILNSAKKFLLIHDFAITSRRKETSTILCLSHDRK